MKHVEVSDFAELIGKRLRELRERRGLSRVEVSAESGLHSKVIARLETGLHLQSLESIARYARACKYDVLDVLECLRYDDYAEWLKRVDSLRRTA